MSHNTDDTTASTTAGTLGKFRSELIDAGFSSETAEQLALDWGRSLASQHQQLKVSA